MRIPSLTRMTEQAPFLKGVCYAPFPPGYDPSTANTTNLWFGSDIAGPNIAPLWGEGFTPVDGPDAGKTFIGRNDLKTLKDLGANLVRLYDWDARNDHRPFLDACVQQGLQVLAPISNYNLGAYGPAPDPIQSIEGLIESFLNEEGTDYHPALYSLIIGSELDMTSVPAASIIDYTRQWVSLEEQNYPFLRCLPIGHPVSFAKHDGVYPCFAWWDQILPDLLTDSTRQLNKRLLLCPHTYNDAFYLYENAEASGQGWVDLAWDRYQLPLLFCEMGQDRTEPDYLTTLQDQVEQSIAYGQDHPQTLWGLCHFQYCDKVWSSHTAEGSFGLTKNTNQETAIVHYGPEDFPHQDVPLSDKDVLPIQVLSLNPSFSVIQEAYA